MFESKEIKINIIHISIVILRLYYKIFYNNKIITILN